LRNDNACLYDIVAAAKRVAGYIAGVQRAEFLTNDMMKAAVVREIEIIGEAASRISKEFKEEHSQVPWRDLSQLRNFYIHGYDQIKYESVWNTARRTVPQVAELV
jgi:uncharacterized protein with HEPN domain